MSNTSALIPRPVVKSCHQFRDYPAKLVERVRYGIPHLKRYQERFQAKQDDLKLFSSENKFFVPYWDVTKDGKVEQRNLKTETQLSEWLGDEFRLDTRDRGSGLAQIVSVKPDPQARFM